MVFWSIFLTVCASQLDEDVTLLQARLARNQWPIVGVSPSVFQCVEKGASMDVFWEGDVSHGLVQCQRECNKRSETCKAFSYREGGAHANKHCQLHESVDHFDASHYTLDDPWHFYHMNCDDQVFPGPPPSPPTPPQHYLTGKKLVFHCVEKARGASNGIWDGEVSGLEECQEKCNDDHPRCSAFSYMERGAQPQRICVLHQSADGFDASAHTQDYPWKFYHGCEGGGDGGGSPPPTPAPPPPGVFQCVEKAFGTSEPIWEGDVIRLEECQEKCNEHNCSAFTYRDGGAHPNNVCRLHQSADEFNPSGHTRDDPWKFYHGCEGVKDKWEAQECQDAAGACTDPTVLEHCMKTCGGGDKWDPQRCHVDDAAGRCTDPYVLEHCMKTCGRGDKEDPSMCQIVAATGSCKFEHFFNQCMKTCGRQERDLRAGAE